MRIDLAFVAVEPGGVVSLQGVAESLADPEIRTPTLAAIRELIDEVRVDCRGEARASSSWALWPA